MITEARKNATSALQKGSAKELVEASNQMTQALGAIRVIVESTPQLQAAGPTQELMGELRDTADKLMYSRRTLIDLTADYNIKLMTFPSNLVASIFRFNAEEGLIMPDDKEYVTVKPSDTKTPETDLN
jgi:LemA protein